MVSVNGFYDTILEWDGRQYRRDCLRVLTSDLHAELDYLDNFAEENPKNYQIWYHRRVIADLLGDGGRELSFTAKVFEIDSKNYHAWAHRF
jgi:protein farnesyltransferase/geranylgeranyltransferase type-1 subunit alpha